MGRCTPVGGKTVRRYSVLFVRQTCRSTWSPFCDGGCFDSSMNN